MGEVSVNAVTMESSYQAVADPDQNTRESPTVADPNKDTKETPTKLRFIVSPGTPTAVSSFLPKETITKTLAECLLFGRGTDADIKINLDTASKRHMTLKVMPPEQNGNSQKVVIKNIGTRKIIAINKERIRQGQEAELKSGCKLLIEDLDVTVEIILSDPQATTYQVSFVQAPVPEIKATPAPGTGADVWPQYPNPQPVGPYGYPGGLPMYQPSVMYPHPYGVMPTMTTRQPFHLSPPPAYDMQPPLNPTYMQQRVAQPLVYMQQPVAQPPGVRAMTTTGVPIQYTCQPRMGSSSAYNYIPPGGMGWGTYDTQVKLPIQAIGKSDEGPVEETGKEARTSIQETQQ